MRKEEAERLMRSAIKMATDADSTLESPRFFLKALAIGLLYIVENTPEKKRK